MTSNFGTDTSISIARLERHGYSPLVSNRPSVPICVYKELAGELKETRVELDTLKLENQQLVRQNLQLRQEIDKVVCSAQKLRRTATGLDSYEPKIVDLPKLKMPKPSTYEGVKDTLPLIVEEASLEHRHREVILEIKTKERERFRERPRNRYKSWWRAIAVLGIVLSGIGAGFTLVNQIREHHPLSMLRIIQH